MGQHQQIKCIYCCLAGTKDIYYMDHLKLNKLYVEDYIKMVCQVDKNIPNNMKQNILNIEKKRKLQ